MLNENVMISLSLSLCLFSSLFHTHFSFMKLHIFTATSLRLLEFAAAAIFSDYACLESIHHHFVEYTKTELKNVERCI